MPVFSPFSRFLAAIAAPAVLVGGGIAAPAAAQDAAAQDAGEDGQAETREAIPDFSQMDANEVIAALRDERRWAAEPCEFGVPLVARMEELRPAASFIQRLSLRTQAFCADEEERYGDGAQLMRQVNALDPENPEVWTTLYFANRVEDAEIALELFANLQGEALEKLDKAIFWPAVRMITQQERGDDFEAQALAWFEGNQIAFIDGDLHAGLARRALSSAVKQDRPEIVNQLLGYITDPSSYTDLLTFREFEAFWPQIEERAGPNLAAVGADNIAKTRNRLTNAPRDRDRFSAAAYALQFHGDFEAAITLAQSWREREERGLALEEGDAWALNIQAYAYDSLGRPDRADAVFDELAAIDPEENYWVVNFVINRASRLVGQGRWAEGLEAAQLARSVPGSPYAEMIVAKDHACALRQLGRADEAVSELDFLRENSEQSVHLTAVGLLCLGLREEAAQLLLVALRDEVTRDSAIAALEAAELDLFYTQSMLPKPRDLMAEYPELAAEFAVHARDLPERLIPRAAGLRVRLDLPEWVDPAE